ncbi:leucine-rich repeat domain-containing protein [Rhizobium sp. Leaf262]|uniref:leucine-rich repeat domain-containing protein n=1 Tax=Rhizobium sp. Leaf262 TaxID=1736312 RepID=UPI0007130722|nr:leucine-rich repeat domain-containing protein [Rhizobium sp. Leaf262]KQO82263.1 hypothetical protein ASF29_17135 [Rhizobium sp. Leaf262]
MVGSSAYYYYMEPEVLREHRAALEQYGVHPDADCPSGTDKTRCLSLNLVDPDSPLEVPAAPKVSQALLAEVARLPGLQYLDLGHTEIDSLAPLIAARDLQELRISVALIHDTGSLGQLTGIKRLELGRVGGADLSAVMRLSQLKYLSLRASEKDDLAPLRTMKTDIEIDHDSWQTGNIGNLADIDGLIKVRLYGVRDLSALSNAKRLRELSLQPKGLDSLAPIAGLVSLERLDIIDSTIKDLTPLSGNTRLKSVALSNTAVSDLSVLAQLRDIETLNLSASDYTDISVLATLPNLKHVNLEGHRKIDLKPLLRSQSLERAYLGHRICWSDRAVVDEIIAKGLNATSYTSSDGVDPIDQLCATYREWRGGVTDERQCIAMADRDCPMSRR